MPKLTWDESGQRFFETGVDRGVLYVAGTDGVAWNGLISVSEGSTGGEAKPYYMDGVKYLNSASSTDFEATIKAFYSPTEFDACDGTASFGTGLFATEQPRKAFGLSYRTRIGNDIDGPDKGYKLHLVYNALAAPSTREYKSMGGGSDAHELAWDITTLPVSLTGRKPTAHIVIDSTKVPVGLLRAIEDILYGTPTSPARMPTGQELISLITTSGNIVVEDLGNGIFTVSGPDENVRMLTPDIFEIDSSSVTMIDTTTYTIESS